MKKIRIIATLEKGRNWSDYYIIMLFFSVLLTIVSLLFIVLAIVDREYVLLTVEFLLIPFAIYCFIMFIKCLQEKRTINDLVKNAILVEATVIRIGEFIEHSRYNTRKLCKIKVIFEFNGKTIKKESGKYNPRKRYTTGGYDSIYRKFIGKKITVLYSPKNEQVLFFKRNG